MNKMELDKEKGFFAKPSNSKIFHIFDKDHRSRCGKVLLLLPDWNSCEQFNGTEKFNKGQDCKACFKKVGLID